MFLSVVIPVYNCEPYLPECLDSLLDQDLDRSEYEIICVNDGSTDGSLAILRRYADREQNVKVLEQTNQGVCSARNHGMDEAKGDYVWFVDADDFIQRNILGKLKRIACEAPNERISMSGYYIFEGAFTPEEERRYRDHSLVANHWTYDVFVTKNLLKRAFLLEHSMKFRYEQLKHSEDQIFLYELCQFHPRQLVFDEEPVYFYRARPDSATHPKSEEELFRSAESHLLATRIDKKLFDGSDKETQISNMLMADLWATLFAIAQLPRRRTRVLIKELKREKLFPLPTPHACTIKKSYMTTRTDFIGRTFDWIYTHMNYRIGYFLMKVKFLLK